MEKQDNIRGKVVVITGGSGGLGAATSRLLATRGAKLVLGDRNKERLEQLAKELRQTGGLATAVVTDVVKREDMNALVSTAVKEFGRIDVLINNAGIMPLAPLEKGLIDEWDRLIDVNIRGVLHGIAAALPHMKRQRSGHIVNIASVAGLKVFTPMGTVYSATKFAVRALSEGLRVEAPDGVRTTIISPGAVKSDLKAGTSDPDSATAVREFYEANEIPADAVARAIAYALEQPADVDVNEIVLRPTVQDF
jgi:NADP-dependent 3-hydroxy acid dehydrogenase YdfG